MFTLTGQLRAGISTSTILTPKVTPAITHQRPNFQSFTHSLNDKHEAESRLKLTQAVSHYQHQLQQELKRPQPQWLKIAHDYNQLGLSLAELGDYQQGLSMLEQSLTYAHNVVTDTCSSLATLYNNRGQLQFLLENFELAAADFNLSYKLLQAATTTADKHELATTYTNLAQLNLIYAKHNQAYQFYQQSLSLKLTLYGTKHLELVSSYNGMAKSLHESGQFIAAAKAYSDCILILKQQQLASTNSELVKLYHNLANFYAVQGKYFKAIKVYKLAIARCSTHTYQQQIMLATLYNDLSVVKRKAGYPSQALDYQIASLELQIKAYSNNHMHPSQTLPLTRDQQKLARIKSLLIQIGHHSPQPNLLLAACYSNLGNCMLEYGDYQTAPQYLIKALASRERSLGISHPQVISIYNELAKYYQILGNYAQAEECQQRGIDLLEVRPGEHELLIANCYVQLGIIYQQRCNFSQAQTAFELAISKSKPMLKQRCLLVAYAYINLGSLYYTLQQPQLAIDYIETAITTITTNSSGSNIYLPLAYNYLAKIKQLQANYTQALKYINLANRHRMQVVAPLVAAITYLDNLGNIAYEQADYSTALTYFQQALKYKQKQFKEDNLDLVSSYNCLGSVAHAQGNLHQALDWHNLALKLQQKLLNHDSLALAITRANLGNVYVNQGQFNLARQEFLTSFNTLKLWLGENHSHVVNLYLNLGHLDHAEGNHQEALTKFQYSLKLLKESLGNMHPLLSNSLLKLADLYMAQTQYDQALTCYEQLLRINLCHPTRPQQIANSYNQLAYCYRMQGKHNEALDMYNQGLSILTDNSENSNMHTATFLGNLGALFFNNGEYTKAEEMYQQGISQLSTSSVLSNDAALLHFNLGILYESRHDLQAAEDAYLNCLRLQLQTLGLKSVKTARTLQSLANFYKNQSEYDNAITFQLENIEILTEQLGPTHLQVIQSYNSLGIINYQAGEFKSALDNFNNCVAVLTNQEQTQAIELCGEVFFNLGIVYSQTNHPKEAVSAFKLALNKHQSLAKPILIKIAEINYHLAHEARKLNILPMAITHGRMALKLFRQHNSPARVLHCNQLIAELEQTQAKLQQRL